MGFLNRAAREVRLFSQFDSSDPWTIPPPGGALGQYSSAGVMVNDEAAIGVVAFFAGVRLLADSISLTPLYGVTIDGDGIRHKMVPSPPQLTDPFWAINLQEGIGQIVVSLILRGNAYVYEVETPMGPAQPGLWRILNPSQVEVTWYDRGARYVDPETGESTPVPGMRKYMISGVEANPMKMTHLANFMLPNGLKGAGIIEYTRDAIGVGIALDDVAGEFFRNGVMSTGIIGLDAPVGDDEARRVTERFKQMHAGVRNAHVPVIMGGGAKYTPITLSPEDAQFLQSRQFQAGQIATLLGIPPHLLGQVDKTTSWGTGIEVQGRAFVDYTLRPYFERLKTMFSSWLPKGQFAWFDTDELTRADTAARYSNYHTALTDGWMNVDTVRGKENYGPLPDGAGQVYRNPVTQSATSNEDGPIKPVDPDPAPNPETGE